MEKTKLKKVLKSTKTVIPTNGPMAVAVISGKQHLLREGDVVTVENLDEEAGAKVSDFDVLFYGSEGNFSFGTPVLKEARVEVEVLGNFKGEKIDVIKFKAKSRYSKKRGYRSSLTQVKVLKIKGGSHGS